MTDKPNYRVFYRYYMLTCRPQPLDDGRFQARVAISAIGGMKTRAQRFVDLGIFILHDDAVQRAESAGKEWVNNAIRANGID